MLIYLFYLLALLLLYFSFRSFVGGIGFLRYFRAELGKPLSDHTPYATIFAPCKGIDEGMLENFDAVLHQDYPDYEVVFIIDHKDDPAAAVIESAWRESSRPVKLAVAPRSLESGQKVENLREGVLHADERSEVFVFVDSDARPSPAWLRSLVAALEDDTVGISTGYRWFISDRFSFASEMRSMWNATVASAIGDGTGNTSFCWGGAMAISRANFERLDVRERWRGTLSDDFAIARIIKAAGLRIKFVPQAITPSIGGCTFGELIEFTNRQMKLTRVYARKLWISSFVGSGVYILVVIAAIALIVSGSGGNELSYFAAWSTLILVAAFSIGKSTLRSVAVRSVLTKFAAETRTQFVFQNILWAVTPVLFFANCTTALLSRTMRWRGTVYKMVSPTETLVDRVSKADSAK